VIAINGKHVMASPAPGQFARLDRAWDEGDHIEVEFDMPTVLESVDAKHPNLMALVHGPLALFAIGPIPEKIAGKELLAATQISTGSTDWQARTAAGNLTLRPFSAINDEHYRLYLNVES
jgi:hypothetical protein